MTSLRKLLLLTCVIPLAACGADDVASPGEGVLVPAPTPSPSPTPGTGTPTPTPGQPAAACPPLASTAWVGPISLSLSPGR